jgi:hypothetical protein
MTIHEPATLATDYLLALAAAIFAWRLGRAHRFWSYGFWFTALGSLLGGTYHGFSQSQALWKATVFAIGIASFFFLFAVSRAMHAVAFVKLVVYGSWMIFHDAFVWVIVDYGVAFVLIAITLAMQRSGATKWILASLAASIAGAVVQTTQFALHRHFNHNDLYHLIQLLSLWLLYRGARLTTSATVQPTIQPR